MYCQRRFCCTGATSQLQGSMPETGEQNGGCSGDLIAPPVFIPSRFAPSSGPMERKELDRFCLLFTLVKAIRTANEDPFLPVSR